MAQTSTNKSMEKMSNELTTNDALVEYNPGQASLLEMRADPERFPRIKTLPREQAVLGISKIVLQAYLLKGQTADPTTIQFISSTLVGEMMDEKKYGAAALSLAEIQVAVKRAVLETEMFGISASSLYKVIIDFCKGEGHANALKVQEINRKSREAAFARSPMAPRITAAVGEYKRNHRNK